MAAYGSLQHIFEKPLPENPTLLESLSSWKQIKSTKPIEDSSFTEIFGELHFKESTLPLSSSSSSSSPYIFNPQARVEKLDENNERSCTKIPSSDYYASSQRKPYHRNSDSFSSMNSESLQLCTEGLGFESSDDVEDIKTDMNTIISITKHTQPHENLSGDQFRRSKTSGGAFPPPISSIGESGKPWVSFRSYRQDGRFVLKEIRIPNQEFLHARREDGRLKLQFFQADDEILEEEVDEVTDDDDDYDDDARESEMIDGKEEENNEQIDHEHH